MELASLTDWERAFHSLGAEQETEPLFNDVRGFGSYKESLPDELRFRECTSPNFFDDVYVVVFNMDSSVVSQRKKQKSND